MTEATNWYKTNEKKEENDKESDKVKKLTTFSENIRKLKGKGSKRKDIKSMEVDGKSKIMSVIFVPHTERSELAKRWRLRLEQFEKVGSIKIKVVERAGSRFTS